jgi:hypothetical protein
MAERALASWNEGTTKQAILAFVDQVTTQGPNYVTVADRIATFDNDGTLWVELISRMGLVQEPNRRPDRAKSEPS